MDQAAPSPEEQDLNASTDFFSFKSRPRKDKGLISNQADSQQQAGSFPQSQYQMGNQQFQTGPPLYQDPLTGPQTMQPSSQQMQRQQSWRQQQYMKQRQYQQQQQQQFQRQQHFQQQQQFQQPMFNTQDSQVSKDSKGGLILCCCIHRRSLYFDSYLGQQKTFLNTYNEHSQNVCTVNSEIFMKSFKRNVCHI